MITVTIRLFAHLADALGCETLRISLDDGATAGAALDRALADHAALAPWRDRIALAVGDRYATRATVLRDGDEVSLLPPVSGG